MIVIPGTRCGRKVVPVLVLFWLVLFSQVEVFCAEGPRLPNQENLSTEKLSNDAAKVAIDHLITVLRLLQKGGPPVYDADTSTPPKDWTPSEAIRQIHGQSVDDYSAEQYLNDYRQSFLEAWHEQFTACVHRRPNGAVRISGGIGDTCCFQSAGTTHGYYDAMRIVGNLAQQAERERMENDTWSPQHWGSGSGWDSARDAPTPSSEAMLFLFSHLVERSNQKSTQPRASGSPTSGNVSQEE